MASDSESVGHAFLSWLLEAQKQGSVFITEELFDKNGKRKRKKIFLIKYRILLPVRK